MAATTLVAVSVDVKVAEALATRQVLLHIPSERESCWH